MEDNKEQNSTKVLDEEEILLVTGAGSSCCNLKYDEYFYKGPYPKNPKDPAVKI
ncbi:hypothetical protein [Alteromonas salexigens]|uniref:hypothetical protein n=1 Tax=Alteromonas salexigens TaxID=2982530 RepID=UPI0021D58B60|nr:hypothetical protein [Alteromonas salexigens]